MPREIPHRTDQLVSVERRLQARADAVADGYLLKGRAGKLLREATRRESAGVHHDPLLLFEATNLITRIDPTDELLTVLRVHWPLRHNLALVCERFSLHMDIGQPATRRVLAQPYGPLTGDLGFESAPNASASPTDADILDITRRVGVATAHDDRHYWPEIGFSALLATEQLYAKRWVQAETHARWSVANLLQVEGAVAVMQYDHVLRDCVAYVVSRTPTALARLSRAKPAIVDELERSPEFAFLHEQILDSDTDLLR